MKAGNHFIQCGLPRGELHAKTRVEFGVRQDRVTRARGWGGVVFGLDWNERWRFDAETLGCTGEDGLSKTEP